MLGITLSLFISAIFTSNFASHIVPTASAGSGSSPSSSSTIWPAPTPVSTNTLSSQLFFILFRNSYSNGAPHEDSSSSLSQVFHATTTPAVHDTAAGHLTSTDHTVKGQDAKKDEELLHRNESRPSEDISPRTEPLNGGRLRGERKVHSNLRGLPKSSPPLDAAKLLEKGTSSSNEGSSKNISKSASEQVENRATLKASLPGNSRNISELLQGRNPSKEYETLLPNANNAAQLRKDLPSSPPQSSVNAKHCDISIGQWVEDESYPLYRPGTCSFVDEAFSCQRNGRPDSKYNRWRWAPRDCVVPRFNGTDLLERLRGKRLVFVGDSLNRNQWESMLCMLRESLSDKRRIVQIHGGRISKLPGAYVFKFVDYECKVEFYTSQYLVDKQQEGTNPNQFTVRLDKMDKSERRWRKANVLVFNTGHWWTSDKIGEGDNRFQEGSIVHPKLDVRVAYSKALSTWAKWVDMYVNLQSTSVFFRGYSPVHYIGGQWNSGGQCQDETEPIFNESFLMPYPSEMQILEGVLHKMKLPVHIFNITRLSDYRKDAHPATYGHAPHHVVRHQDCSHWCLPGLPDTWNELLYFSLIQQSWMAP